MLFACFLYVIKLIERGTTRNVNYTCLARDVKRQCSSRNRSVRCSCARTFWSKYLAPSNLFFSSRFVEKSKFHGARNVRCRRYKHRSMVGNNDSSCDVNASRAYFFLFSRTSPP
uniref:Uncharacterized protein n=1 Tax=Ixodes scapularis TaxID=6945 RepID=A0A4D5RCG0_IXOSC